MKGQEATAAGGDEDRPVKSRQRRDAAYMLQNAESVIIVLVIAVAQAQHAVREMAELLEAEA